MKTHLYREGIFGLAEGQVWHDNQRWWVDIETGRVHACDGSVHTSNGSIGQYFFLSAWHQWLAK
jgi:sugar lactone lactonase YvrE